MFLELTRAFLHFLCPMEAKGCSQRWKLHLPEFKYSRRCPSLTKKDSERGKMEKERDRGKGVSMAPISRYLTDRQYVMRKPLFSAEQHTSILKKTQLQKHTEKVRRTETEFLLRHMLYYVNVMANYMSVKCMKFQFQSHFSL